MPGVGDYIDRLVETLFGASFDVQASVVIFLLLCIVIVQIIRTITDGSRRSATW